MTTPGTPPRTGRTVRIGITGPIGCGKSTVAHWLADAGAVIVDADKVARAVTAPGEPTHDAIIARFGPAVATPEGVLDRAALARLVFGDADALRDLEALVHPAVRPRILAALVEAEAGRAPAVVVEAIRLVEGGLAALCDEVWLVACDPDTQRARLRGRGMDAADLERRLAAQAGLIEVVRPAATRVIDTAGSPAATHRVVLAALGDALRRGAG